MTESSQTDHPCFLRLLYFNVVLKFDTRPNNLCKASGVQGRLSGLCILTEPLGNPPSTASFKH